MRAGEKTTSAGGSGNLQEDCLLVTSGATPVKSHQHVPQMTDE